jgi:hypothetical protein
MWETDLRNLSVRAQIRITGICYFKALTHWQTWMAVALLALLALVSIRLGAAFSLTYGIFNIAGLLGVGIGGGILALVMSRQAKKHVDEVTKQILKTEH